MSQKPRGLEIRRPGLEAEICLAVGPAARRRLQGTKRGDRGDGLGGAARVRADRGAARGPHCETGAAGAESAGSA